MSTEFYCALLSYLVGAKPDVLLYYNNCLLLYTLIFSAVEIVSSCSNVDNYCNVVILLSWHFVDVVTVK